MRKEIKDFKDMKEINEAGKKTLNSLRSLLSLSSLYTHHHTPTRLFFDFRGADFAMNAVRPGWAVLDVLPIRGGQGRAKAAL
ncbi:MAG: hypothetical protein IJN98_01115 [Alistipes sp.]|nr:hypothetical protein [Alistipes sp.]